MPVEQFTELHYCSISIAILTTAFCTPDENENKPLTDKQKKHFRVLGTVMVVLLALISCLLIHFYQSSYSVLIDMTLLVVSMFMPEQEPHLHGVLTARCRAENRTLAGH